MKCARINTPAFLFCEKQTGIFPETDEVFFWIIRKNISRKTGSTIIFITHDIDEAIILGSRILVMSRRPGTIRKTIPVVLSCKRDHTAYSDPGFMSIKKEIMDLLWEEQVQITEEKKL